MLSGRFAEASEDTALREMVHVAAANLPGCCGATTIVWVHDQPIRAVASQPDLGGLVQAERQLPDSPTQAARLTGDPKTIRDTLSDDRWPSYSAVALGIGVRSVTTGVATLDGQTVTCTLYAVRPDGLPAGSAAVATALIRQSVLATTQQGAFERAQREVHQLTEAIATRRVVEQARGMVMQALRCDENAAFEHLMRLSRQQHRRIAEVAKTLVDSHPTTSAAISAQVLAPDSHRP